MNAKIAAIVLIKKNAPISINCTQKSKKSGWEVIFFQLKKLLKKPKNGSIIKVQAKKSGRNPKMKGNPFGFFYIENEGICSII